MNAKARHVAAFRGCLQRLAELAVRWLARETLPPDNAAEPSSSSSSLASSSSLSVFLVNEHYVIKPARSCVAFGWHTDEAEQFAGMRPPPYVSVWVPLDDAC